MDTLKYVCDKFNIDLTKPSPFPIACGRFQDIPKLFTELGFKIGAEIGVESARYSKCLLEGIPELTLYGVDLWQAYKGYKDFGSNKLAEAELMAIELAKTHKLIIKKGWSHEIVKSFADESLDFVFIDGNHNYESCVQDIALWSKKVRNGGIVYGHDYDDYTNRGRWHEMHVIQAVDGWMKSYKIHPWFILTNNRNRCWMHIK